MKLLKNILRLTPILLAFVGLALTGYRSDLPIGIAVPGAETDFITTLHQFEQEKPMPLFLTTTYYFSTSGSTGNTGLSVSSPWPLSKYTTVGVGGDSLLMKKGDTFTGPVTYSRSGSAGVPIVLDLYGTALANPIIDGAGSTTAPVLKITGNYININNLVVQNNAFIGHGVLELSGVHDINVNNCEWNTGYRGLFIQNCTGNVTVKYCYGALITHPNGTGGRANGDGAFLQTDTWSGAGFEAANNYFYTLPDAGVGDIISLYKSNGTSGSHMLVHDNQVRGGGIDVAGLCQIGMGDTGGSYQDAYNNLLANDPYAAIQIAGGSNITATNNQIYMARYIFSNGHGSLFGIGVFPAGGFTPTVTTVSGNIINARDYNNNITNIYRDASLSDPTGWSTNTQNGIAGAVTNSILPDPLWTGSPWNTATTPLSFGTLANAFIGAADYSPGAVSSSNQGITYTSDNAAVATIVSGKIHLVATGTANITANDQFNTISQPLTVLTGSTIIFKGRKIHAN